MLLMALRARIDPWRAAAGLVGWLAARGAVA